MKAILIGYLLIIFLINGCTIRYINPLQPLTDTEMSKLVRHTIIDVLSDKNKKSKSGGFVSDKSGLLFYYEADLDTIFFEFSGFIKSSANNQIDSGYFKMTVYGKNFYFYILDNDFSSQNINSLYRYIDERGDTISVHYNNKQSSLQKNKYFTFTTYVYYLLALKDFYNQISLKIYLTKNPQNLGVLFNLILL